MSHRKREVTAAPRFANRPLAFALLAVLAVAADARADVANEPAASDDDVSVQAEPDESNPEPANEEETEKEISIDADSSLTVPDKLDGRRGWAINADVRALGASTMLEGRDGEDFNEQEILARARLGGSRSLTESFRFGARVAAACNSEGCRVDNIFDDGVIENDTNQIEIDQAFLHWYKDDHFDVAVGRMQTRFITKGGVFAKSLDRNDSNNTRITWTDGAHGTMKHSNGWESHLIVQYNPEDGPAQVLREPMDFSSEDSRVSGFVSVLNEKPFRYLTQRGFDVSYYPSALLKDGFVTGSRVEDYWGFVARAAGRVPERSEGIRLRFSAELGYAPTTPTEVGVNLPGDGDTDGTAIALTVSLMDFFPSHSIGINYARTGAGWLLSPQYNRNERLAEIRYVWVLGSRITLDLRLLRRRDLVQYTNAVRKRDEVDAFLRMTWRFDDQWPAFVY